MWKDLERSGEWKRREGKRGERKDQQESILILTKIVNLESVELYNRLLSKGILVRYYENELLKNYLRISIGSREQNQKLLDFIKQ